MMGKIAVSLEGHPEDMRRIYDHLRYHVKEISEANVDELDKIKAKVTFTVTI